MKQLILIALLALAACDSDNDVDRNVVTNQPSGCVRDANGVCQQDGPVQPES